MHPCIWKNDHFLVSGSVSACGLSALSVYWLVIAIAALQDSGSGSALIDDENNPIRTEMNAPVSMLGCTGFFMTSLNVLLLLVNRSRIALTFNERNIFFTSCVTLGRLRNSAISLEPDTEKHSIRRRKAFIRDVVTSRNTWTFVADCRMYREISLGVARIHSQRSQSRKPQPKRGH